MPDNKTKDYADNRVLLNRVKEYVVRYKRTRDPKHFESILRLTDLLIVHTAKKLKRTRRYLRYIPKQEIYHTGIIGLYEAVDKMPVDVEPEKIPAWIVAYMISNVRRLYTYLDREVEGLVDDNTDLPVDQGDEKARVAVDHPEVTAILDDLQTLVNRRLITKYDLNLLNDKYIKGKTSVDIAKAQHIPVTTLKCRLYMVLKKVSVYFKYP